MKTRIYAAPAVKGLKLLFEHHKRIYFFAHLKSSVDFIQTSTQCSPGKGVYRVCSRWRRMTYLGRFKFSSDNLRQTLEQFAGVN